MAGADTQTRVQTITKNIEDSYQALRSSARNISGLLSAGRATCEDVQAYNVWALAVYNSQLGMAQTLRAAGEQNVPNIPYPTLFAWNNVPGEQAYSITCTPGADQSLHGVLERALKGPTAASRYLSSKDIKVVTSDPWVFKPEGAPSIAELVSKMPKQGLGVAPIVLLVVIAGITIGIAVGLQALFNYLEENAIQEETTDRMRISMQAFDKYTSARLSCLSTCTSQGKSVEDCTDYCDKLVTKPDLVVDPARRKQMTTLAWIGAAAATIVVAIIGYKLYQRKLRTGSYLPRLIPD